MLEHIKKHHKKYLFTLIRGGLFYKLAIFILAGLGITFTLQQTNIKADVQTGCYTTGQYLTGGYFTGGYQTGSYLTGGYVTGGYYTGGYYTGGYTTGCYMTGGYFTGGYLSGEERTGEYWTGEYEEGCYETGAYWTGEYWTGEYVTGQYMTGQYYTGEYFTGQYMTGGYVTGCIIIPTDTTKPTITGITVTLNGVRNSYIGLSGTARIGFVSDEELTGNIVTIRGRPADLLSRSGLQYTYQQILSTSNTEGALNFSIAYNDLVGNTGFYSATGPVIFDKTAPVIGDMNLSGDDVDGFTLAWQTNESTKYTLEYTISGNPGIITSGASYATSFNYLFTGITIGKTCIFVLNVADRIGNTTQFSGEIEITNNGVVNFDYRTIGSNIVSVTTGDTYTDESTTGSLATLAVTLKKEIEKFNKCKKSVEYKTLDLKVQGKDFTLNMPSFEKDAIKTITQSFIVFMVKQLKSDENLTDETMALITRKFNNFLVILKLVRDDNNSCKQNLSNYHILQFQNTMEEFGIQLE